MAAMSQDEILDAIGKMSVLELSELLKKFEEKFGVSASAPMMVGAMPMAGAATAAAAEEQTEFSVVLISAGDKKIQVIKEIRPITGLGLKEAKDLVDNAPATIKEGISKDEANEIVKKLQEAGAQVEIK